MEITKKQKIDFELNMENLNRSNNKNKRFTIKRTPLLEINKENKGLSDHTYAKQKTFIQVLANKHENTNNYMNNGKAKLIDASVQCNLSHETSCTTKYSQTTYTFTDVCKLKKENQLLKSEVKQLKSKIKKLEATMLSHEESYENFPQFVKSVQANEAKCKFYTGLVISQLMALYAFLSPFENLQYWGSRGVSTMKKKKLLPLEELVLVLIRLRTGLLITDLRYRFNLAGSYISCLVNTWVQLMYTKFNVIRPMMFPTRDYIKENLPALFFGVKNIRVIIDCAEFICQSPSNLDQQSNVYSSYKAHTTFKVLLGCTPNGVISFVSELFEGSISDNDLVKKSHLMDLLEEGDLVMADRGFQIQDLANQKQVHLNIPPFLKGRERLTASEEIETKSIANRRIYIEHIVRRIKQFRILQRVIPLNMRGTISQIVFVCACLVNFQEPLLKPYKDT